jgi:hypothetical protein|tara:strand:- start:193 stop:339 length:147 start_codon:yes stop_codon:yes gene_type:complete
MQEKVVDEDREVAVARALMAARAARAANRVAVASALPGNTFEQDAKQL